MIYLWLIPQTQQTFVDAARSPVVPDCTQQCQHCIDHVQSVTVRHPQHHTLASAQDYPGPGNRQRAEPANKPENVSNGKNQRWPHWCWKCSSVPQNSCSSGNYSSLGWNTGHTHCWAVWCRYYSCRTHQQRRGSCLACDIGTTELHTRIAQFDSHCQLVAGQSAGLLGNTAPGFGRSWSTGKLADCCSENMLLLVHYQLVDLVQPVRCVALEFHSAEGTECLGNSLCVVRTALLDSSVLIARHYEH